jgi:hypothetical protein
MSAEAAGASAGGSAPSGGGGGGGGGGSGRGGRGGRGRGAPKAAPPVAATHYLMYLDALSVVRAPREGEDEADGDAAPRGPGLRALQGAAVFSPRDLAFIARFAQEAAAAGGALRLLVGSLCPSIYGASLVKAGLLLALLGGARGRDGAGVRGDIHVLLLGDPGLGKSQLLAAAVAAAPRGVYVCGPTVSAVGLTAAVGRDPATGAPSLDAGACVLADRGVCAVDELDKMKPQHGALLEVMEQGTVSIAKAGIAATLPARCALLAAANPAGGRYNRAKSVVQNLAMGAPLLSRFDLIFVLQDTADEARDAALSEHLLAARAGTLRGGGGAGAGERGGQRLLEFGAGAQPQQRAPLEERLRCARGAAAARGARAREASRARACPCLLAGRSRATSRCRRRCCASMWRTRAATCTHTCCPRRRKCCCSA